MSSTPVSRKVIREAIAAGLSVGVTSAQAVYSYAAADFDGQSPVVRVSSSSSERPQLTAAGIRSMMRFTVDVWVLLSDRDGWNEQDAEDTLDTVEHEIITWMVGNQNTDNWTSLQYDAPTTTFPAIIGGDTWLVEEITVRAEVYG